jgi:hypothetical protein
LPYWKAGLAALGGGLSLAIHGRVLVREALLGLGRTVVSEIIAVSEIGASNLFANLVWRGCMVAQSDTATEP